MDLQLRGRQALVTGAGSGIGRGIAQALATEGVRLALTARHAEGLAKTAELVRTAGGGPPVEIVGDLTDAAQVERVAKQALDALHGLDILVNNAGGSRPIDDLGTEEGWEESFALNFAAARRLTGHLRDNIRNSGRGRVIVVTGAVVVRQVNAASPAKAALQSWARSLSFALAPHGATVNSIVPGRIESRQIMERLHPTEESRQRFIAENIPAGRFGTPEEIAPLAAFLASPRAGYITGASIPVDGGLARLAF